jgi:two-component system C4-dicarboxylate transport sensor histidine kinase DctB
MIHQLTIAYECVNSIGNSLELKPMLSDVITTFVKRTGAVGGCYIKKIPVVHVGRPFNVSHLHFATNALFYTDKTNEGNFLSIPINEGHFTFLYKNDPDLELLGNMFSNFKTKLSNAIDACRSVEKLKSMNIDLEHQVSEEKNRNQLNEKLMIAQSRMAIMGEMIGMIAHQWRQPITVIGMVTNNAILDIHTGKFHPDRMLDDLDLIDKQVHFLSQTIDDFRNFFKPNKLPQQFHFFDITNEIHTIMGKSLENHAIQMIFSGEMNASMQTYKNELLQVFLNIFSNSRDAFLDNNIEDATITCSCENRDTSILFLIKDNGGGIPQPIVNYIFEPYFSTKGEKNGTGLGLYMSSIIIEKHLKGNIRVCSHDGITTFAIQIPKILVNGELNVY